MLFVSREELRLEIRSAIEESLQRGHADLRRRLAEDFRRGFREHAAPSSAWGASVAAGIPRPLGMPGSVGNQGADSAPEDDILFGPRCKGGGTIPQMRRDLTGDIDTIDLEDPDRAESVMTPGGTLTPAVTLTGPMPLQSVLPTSNSGLKENHQVAHGSDEPHTLESKKSMEDLKSPTLNQQSYLVNKLTAGMKRDGPVSEVAPKSSSTGEFIARLVQNGNFDSFICSLVVLNALFIGVQTDHVATHLGEKVPLAMRVVEVVFCGIFLVEIGMRIYVWRCMFFTMPGREWNFLDLFVVGLQVFEGLGAAMVNHFENVVPGGGFSFIRILRVLQLIRVVRLVRIIRAISDLRILVVSLLASMKSLVWIVILFILLIYCVSIYITQLVADFRRGSCREVSSEGCDSLDSFYGSLGNTMLSMFESISGGKDWGDLLEPLVTQISPWMAFLFTMYIAFALLALLNVVTGVFVDSVMKSTKSDRDLFLINNARELFQSLPGGLMSNMTWDTFKDKVDAPQMQEFFKAIDVDPSEAKGLFNLLDLNHSGNVSAQEFLNGCLRLRGPARALDLALLMKQVSSIAKKLKAL